MTTAGAGDGLRDILRRAQRLGFVGPGPVEDHVAHARALAAFTGAPTGPVLDLGSGGGVPGLVLATEWIDAELVLLDAQRRRVDHLRWAVHHLDAEDRITVVHGRAEVVARDPQWRGRFGLVVARAFAAPPVTAECAVGFLRPGGSLVVADAPDEAEPTGRARSGPRWPADGIARLGMTAVRRDHAAGAAFIELRTHDAPADRWPRRNGTPQKRPLW